MNKRRNEGTNETYQTRLDSTRLLHSLSTSAANLLFSKVEELVLSNQTNVARSHIYHSNPKHHQQQIEMKGTAQ